MFSLPSFQRLVVAAFCFNNLAAVRILVNFHRSRLASALRICNHSSAFAATCLRGEDVDDVTKTEASPAMARTSKGLVYAAAETPKQLRLPKETGSATTTNSNFHGLRISLGCLQKI